MGIKTPVIIITAYATVKNAVDCTNLGAVAYVQKPFSADKIRNVLKEFDDNYVYSDREFIDTETIISSIKARLESQKYYQALDLAKRVMSIELNVPEVYLLISKAYKGLDDKENSERFLRFYESFDVKP